MSSWTLRADSLRPGFALRTGEERVKWPCSHLADGGGERGQGLLAGAGMCDKIKAFGLPGPHLGFT